VLNLAVCRPGGGPPHAGAERVEMDGVGVGCAVVETPEPAFDERDPANARRVLVRVRAFSCNYRDKGRIFRAVEAVRETGFYVVGSELVGEVVAAGPQVSRVAVGDRVVGDNALPSLTGGEWPVGIPTNHASREYQAFHEAKVARVPANMSDAVAAAFSLGAQTAYSMARRLEAGPGTTALVTSARANTSLMAIGALRARGARVWATTTSAAHHDALRALGVEEVFRLEPAMDTFRDHPALAAVAAGLGGFDCAVDPFFDLHLRRVLPVLRFGGRYVTCGFFDQFEGRVAGPAQAGADCLAGLQIAMLKNVHVIGNCLGLASDLEAALADYAAGRLTVPVDGVVGGGRTAEFMDRTFNARDRFGKVVYAYA
jgi:NADPH:quinone reductase-like Zn-dependent oxidoreductase